MYRVHVCRGPSCSARGSAALFDAFCAEVDRRGIFASVEVLATTCRSRCEDGPSVNIYPGPVFYNWVDERAITTIVDRHLRHGRIAEAWLYPTVSTPRSLSGAPSYISALDKLFARDGLGSAEDTDTPAEREIVRRKSTN